MTEPSSPLILLVDDDVDCHEVHRHFLEVAGFRVCCCFDPEEALSKMHEQRPDLVVTDLMMSSLDSGFSLARSIKETPGWETIPVVVLTAVGTQLGYDFWPRSDADLAAMNADAYLAKPVTPKLLVEKIRELLARG